MSHYYSDVQVSAADATEFIEDFPCAEGHSGDNCRARKNTMSHYYSDVQTSKPAMKGLS